MLGTTVPGCRRQNTLTKIRPVKPAGGHGNTPLGKAKGAPECAPSHQMEPDYMNGTTTAETLALVKDALAKGPDSLMKSINTGTGLTAYDLQPSAKNLYPAATPIR